MTTAEPRPATTPSDDAIVRDPGIWSVPAVPDPVIPVPRHCEPGQGTYPEWCERHPGHFWCRVCDGWYGLSHEDHHARGSRHGRDRHLAEHCACRPCRQLVNEGAGGDALNQGAVDAAVLAVQSHPSTSFVAPCESLARTALEAAAAVLCGRPLTAPLEDDPDHTDCADVCGDVYLGYDAYPPEGHA